MMRLVSRAKRKPVRVARVCRSGHILVLVPERHALGLKSGGRVRVLQLTLNVFQDGHNRRRIAHRGEGVEVTVNLTLLPVFILGSNHDSHEGRPVDKLLDQFLRRKERQGVDPFPFQRVLPLSVGVTSMCTSLRYLHRGSAHAYGSLSGASLPPSLSCIRPSGTPFLSVEGSSLPCDPSASPFSCTPFR